MPENSRKSVVIARLTSCGGCREVLRDLVRDNPDLHNFYDFENFDPTQKNDPVKRYDLTIIDGQPIGTKQIEIARTLRRRSQEVIAIGTCAHTGGVYFNKKHKTLPELIRVDFIVPGCPITSEEIAKCLMDRYWGKIFRLPDLGVCFECRQNGNNCLIKNGKPCFGPATRGGCNAICINHGEACFGCRGTKPDVNIELIDEILKPILEEMGSANLKSIYGKTGLR